jgi:hypothetical protein
MTVVAVGSPSAFSPHYKVAGLKGKKPLTRLATLATLSPWERVSVDGVLSSRRRTGEGSLP